jgi:hypothetical protein
MAAAAVQPSSSSSSSSQSAFLSSSSWCPCWRSCGPLTRRYWDRCTSSTYGVKFCSIVILLECAYIALTGRGVISILQAIVGIIFAVEGFWGAVRFDRPSIKRYLIFLVCDFAVGIAVGILDLETVNEYCSTAADQDSVDDCHRTYSLYAYILIGLKAVTVPLFFLVSTLFYLKLLTVQRAQRERLNTSAGRRATQRRAGKAATDPLYWHGELLAEEEGDDEESGYPGTLIQGDVDQRKQAQLRTELALKRGDREELRQLEDGGSVVLKDSDEEEDEKGNRGIAAM